jgi:4-hydroxy-tetrahydrodipicolinate synthase
MNHFQGVYTIMPTPFTAAGALDLESLATLTDFLISLGVDGLVVLGVLGEAPKLSQAEQDEVIRTTVRSAAGRVPVFAGSGAGGTDLAIEKSLSAIKLGAAGLLVAPPPVQDDGVIFEYYRRIEAAVDSVIILHDFPAATGILLSPQLIVRLHAELPNVQVVKLEETPSVAKITAIRGLGSAISIVGGLGGMFFLEELERGSNGMMTGFSYPEVLVGIYRAYQAGDREKARQLFYAACPVLRYEFQPGIGLALRKEVYRQRGAIRSAFVRHPGAQIDEQLKAELASVLEYCGLV